MPPAIFKNKQHQKTFEEDGYLKIKLLKPDDVEHLHSLFQKYFPEPSKDFYSTSFNNDFTLKKEVSQAIGEIIAPRLELFFTDYTWFGSAFLSKGDGPRSEMPMHQDWSIVDENKFYALNIWTPLQDTNERNGTLEVIPGSHLWQDQVRAPTLPFYYNGYQTQLQSKLQRVNVMATEAIVLNQAVIHSSKPNATKDIRIAITSGIKTKGAPMLFHYWDKNNPTQIEEFYQEDDFLIRFTNFHQSIYERPTIGRSQGLKPFNLGNPTAEDVQKLLGKRNPESGKNTFAGKLLKWITP